VSSSNSDRERDETPAVADGHASADRQPELPTTHYTLLTSSEADTEALAERLARTLRPGDVLLLHGDLGAGKTAFVRGLARGLGADPADVSSPTFTIVQSYRGATLTLVHVDLYRLTPVEVEDVALDDLLSPANVMAVEWAERWTSPPPGATEIRFEHAGADERRITVAGTARHG
jgi:tRNA threonylcarbamoyladenosine biosynthesis protein TsaE